MQDGTDETGDGRITDLEIQALVDGELSLSRKSEVTAHLAQTRRLQQRHNDLCHQRDILQMWWSFYGKPG